MASLSYRNGEWLCRRRPTLVVVIVPLPLEDIRPALHLD